MTSPCATCQTSRCCTVFDPELTGPDLARLSRGLGLAPEQFATLAPVHARDAGESGVRLGGVETWELRLRRAVRTNRVRSPTTVRGEGEGGGRRCVFLLHLAPGLNRCAVHPLRPAVCRLYPSDLTRFGVMIGTPADICPPGAFAPERVDLAPFRLAHAQAAEERARWRSFLSAWHAPLRQADLAARSPEEARSAFYSAVLAAEAAAPGGPARRPSEGASGE
jgi:Fe-S-cluster containining protein